MDQIPRRLLFLLLTLSVSNVGLGEEPKEDDYRRWTTSSGQRTKIELAVVDASGNLVRFKRKDDGREFTFPLNRLSADDQQRIREANGLDQPPPSADPRASAARSDSNARWPAPELSDANLDEWSEFMWPKPNELRWRKIRWHNNLGEAAEEAKRLNRPILLWTMNGNPCGET